MADSCPGCLDIAAGAPWPQTAGRHVCGRAPNAQPEPSEADRKSAYRAVADLIDALIEARVVAATPLAEAFPDRPGVVEQVLRIRDAMLGASRVPLSPGAEPLNLSRAAPDSGEAPSPAGVSPPSAGAVGSSPDLDGVDPQRVLSQLDGLLHVAAWVRAVLEGYVAGKSSAEWLREQAPTMALSLGMELAVLQKLGCAVEVRGSPLPEPSPHRLRAVSAEEGQ